jgi:hypothetical protein
MGFGAIIIIRLLFGVCMVFIIGYVFGGFSKNPALVTLTKVAAILAIVLFIGANALAMRFASGKCGPDKWKRMELRAPK